MHHEFGAPNAQPALPRSTEEYEANPSTKLNALIDILQYHTEKAGRPFLYVDVDEDGAPTDETNTLAKSDELPLHMTGQRAFEPSALDDAANKAAAAMARDEDDAMDEDTDQPEDYDKIVVYCAFPSQNEYLKTVSGPSSFMYIKTDPGVGSSPLRLGRPAAFPQRRHDSSGPRERPREVQDREEIDGPHSVSSWHRGAQPRLRKHPRHLRKSPIAISICG